MAAREGSLEAPKRLPIEWQSSDYYDQAKVDAELHRVFDVCHGCRRCVSLCQSFPVLFDLVDNSPTLEVDGVSTADYGKVVEQCYLCDLCAETKCPYLPPHEWAVDFPHLMLRAKAAKFASEGAPWRDRLITTTDFVLPAASLPGVAPIVNASLSNSFVRSQVDRFVGIHADAPLPKFHTRTAKRRVGDTGAARSPVSTDRTSGQVAIYVTCYGNYNEPDVVADLAVLFDHNGIAVHIVKDDKCCGMPKLGLGDLQAVRRLKEHNIPRLIELVDAGYDLTAPIPSCVLMYKQELPLLFTDDPDVARVAAAFFDPFEYLMLRNKAGLLKTDWSKGLGKVAYHAACHQRVQRMGSHTKDLLAMIPGTEVTVIERCSGHDGTYAMKSETHELAMKIARPVIERVTNAAPDLYGSDCPMAGRLIEHGYDGTATALHPISMVRRAYGL